MVLPKPLAAAALLQAIDASELKPLRKAIVTHATVADGTDVLKEGRARCATGWRSSSAFRRQSSCPSRCAHHHLVSRAGACGTPAPRATRCYSAARLSRCRAGRGGSARRSRRGRRRHVSAATGRAVAARVSTSVCAAVNAGLASKTDKERTSPSALPSGWARTLPSPRPQGLRLDMPWQVRGPPHAALPQPLSLP